MKGFKELVRLPSAVADIMSYSVVTVDVEVNIKDTAQRAHK